MIATLISRRRWQASHWSRLRRARPSVTLFTGTVAKVASLIAIVVGGYQFAHGEPGAKKTLAGVASGTGIAVMATNVLTWLWGS